MAEDNELDDRIDTFLEQTPGWSQKKIEIPTMELLSLIEEGEEIVQESMGYVSHRYDGYPYDKADTDVEGVIDTLYSLQTILRNRLNAAHDMVSSSEMDADSVDDAFDSVVERQDGMQVAIDKLKKHGHYEKIAPEEVAYPD